MPYYTTSMTAATTVTDATWFYWASTAGTTSATTTIDFYATSGTVWVAWTTNEPVVEEFALVRVEADRRREMERRQEHIVAVAQRKEADDRAEVLLVDNLSARQRAEYREHRHFTVHGKSGYRYRVRRGRQGNIDVVNRDGVIEARLCAHPVEQVPDADTMLAQKLWLEHDDRAFEGMANRSWVRKAAPVLPPLH